MDDEKRAIIEKLEEENMKKSKKPRPRDLYDFDELRRLHWQREQLQQFEAPPQQEYKTSLASLLEVAQPPVIKDYLFDQGVATGTGVDFRPKQV